MSVQQEKTQQISDANLVLISLSFLFFFFGLDLMVSIETNICSECSAFPIYDPLVIADALVLLVAFIALASILSKIRVQGNNLAEIEA